MNLNRRSLPASKSLVIAWLALAACGSPAPRAEPVNAVAVMPWQGDRAALPAFSTVDPNAPKPPIAPIAPHETTLHGAVRKDDYFWLRDKGTPDVVAYLEAENAYTDFLMKPLAPVEDALYGEMLRRVKETDTSVPVASGGWLYYRRTEAGKNYPIYARAKRSASPSGAAERSAPEEVLLDLNEVGRRETFVGLGPHALSDDGNLYAFALDTTGFRQYTLAIKDMRKGALLSEHVERVDDVAFSRDGRTLLYAVEDRTTKRSSEVYRHVIGTPVSKDVLVYREDDEKFEVSVARTRSKEYFVITSASHTTSEVRVIPTATPNATPRLIAPREQGHEYYVSHQGPLFYIRTNSGGRNFRLVTAPVNDPARARWREIVPHRADVMLEGVELFARHTVLLERQDALVHVSVVDRTTGKTARIAMPEPTYELGADENPEPNATSFRFGYESPVTPSSVYEIDFKTLALVKLKETEVPTYDKSLYETARLHATARDGTEVPISIVHKKGITNDGRHPILLSGYGAYGLPNDASFSSPAVSLLDRGFVVAVAHIRGGGDLGKGWHDAGRMANKKNTFTDFIDCAEYLVKAGWAARDRVAIEGGSAGGLLMGAVVNMRPDLFRVVVSRAPFVDVVNTMLDTSLPLTVGELEEWGNPQKPEEYAWIAEYSPYDNIAKKAYPAMLVKTSYNDSQVMYWEPAKYVAKLRAMKTDSNRLALRTNMQPAGHSGQSGRYNRLHERAFDFAFILHEVAAPEGAGAEAVGANR